MAVVDDGGWTVSLWSSFETVFDRLDPIGGSIDDVEASAPSIGGGVYSRCWSPCDAVFVFELICCVRSNIFFLRIPLLYASSSFLRRLAYFSSFLPRSCFSVDAK